MKSESNPIRKMASKKREELTDNDYTRPRRDRSQIEMTDNRYKNIFESRPVLKSVTFLFEDDFDFTLTGEEFKSELEKVVLSLLDNITLHELAKHIFGRSVEEWKRVRDE